MPTSRVPIIDPQNLGTMEVLEVREQRDVFTKRMTRVKQVWTKYDPPLGAAYDVENTEFDPIVIVEEAATFFDLGYDARVNAAARAVTLAYSWGNNLDAIATRYPGGVPRLPGESDERYRRRIWLSPDLLNAAGPDEAYIQRALTAVPELWDASAVAHEGTPNVYVTLMQRGPEPAPTKEQLLAVRSALHEKNVKPLTDVITVQPVMVRPIEYMIELWLYPGPSGNVVLDSVYKAITGQTRAEHNPATYYAMSQDGKALRYNGLIQQKYWIGSDHTETDLQAAIKSAGGIHHAEIILPTVNQNVGMNGVIKVTNVEIIVKGRTE